MNDFLTIAESEKKFLDGISKSASFIATVISEGELKAGTGQNGDWMRKEFTIEDATKTIKITAWNEEIKSLKVGYKYEFNSPYWKEYKGSPQLSLGQYCQVKCIGSAGTQETFNESKNEEQRLPETTARAEDVNGGKLPAISDAMAEFVEYETVQLLQIENRVIATIRIFMPRLQDPNPAFVGLFVKEIYRESKRLNFKKASEK